MKKILSLIMLSLILVFSGCGNIEPDNPEPVIDDVVEDENDDVGNDEDDNDEPGTPVTTVAMPDPDVSLQADSDDSTENHYPDEYNEIPSEAWEEMLKYVAGRTQLMGTIPANACMADATEDGYEDVCATFYTGSGIVTQMVVIYDVEKHRGYTLSQRGTYDYVIEGVEDGILLVTRSDYDHEEPDVTGAVVISFGYPIFIEDIDMLKQGLSYKTISMFGYCAEELLPGDTASGDYLSSMDFYYVRWMLYKVSGIFYGTDQVEQEVADGMYGEPEKVPTSLRRMPYEDWVHLVEEVFMEEDAGNLFANLDDSFRGEIAVYYSPEDDYIYLQQGAIGDIIEWNLESIFQEGTRYVLKYDIYGNEWLWTTEVTIEEADNTYGYRLISIETVDEAAGI